MQVSYYLSLNCSLESDSLVFVAVPDLDRNYFDCMGSNRLFFVFRRELGWVWFHRKSRLISTIYWTGYVPALARFATFRSYSEQRNSILMFFSFRNSNSFPPICRIPNDVCRDCARPDNRSFRGSRSVPALPPVHSVSAVKVSKCSVVLMRIFNLIQAVGALGLLPIYSLDLERPRLPRRLGGEPPTARRNTGASAQDTLSHSA